MSSYTMGFRKVGNAEHRRDKRLRLPIFTVKIAGGCYDSLNWSLGGILLGNYDGYLFQGMAIPISIRVKDPGQPDWAAEDGLVIEALVIRHDLEKRQLALKFARLTPTVLDFFERAYNFHGRRR
ncbi:hypothetical protein [Dongia sp.]|uniref:hypothetical protein n=1 Tax=Dongia sp. TaxID=1977262 RepID=UPI0035B0E2A0